MSEEDSKAEFSTWTFDKACPSMDWTPLIPVELSLTANVKEDQLTTDLVVLPVAAAAEEKGDLRLDGLTATVDESLVDGALSQVLEEQAKALAKAGGTSGAPIRVIANGKATKYLLLNVGKIDDIKDAAGFGLGKAVAKACADEKKLTSATVVLPEALASNETVVTDLVTSLYSSLYADNRFRAKKKPVAEDLKTITIASEGATCDVAVLEKGQSIATGVVMAKDIVNAPHNVLNSESLAETAQRIAAESKDGTLTCKILNKEECEARGMGAYLAVARGSETEPKFIHLTYKPADGKVNSKVALVGKGLLFDTGGVSFYRQAQSVSLYCITYGREISYIIFSIS
jgi:leucyl aminopeptidase